MLKKIGVSKSRKSVGKVSKNQKILLQLNFRRNYMESIKQVCKESGSEFK